MWVQLPRHMTSQKLAPADQERKDATGRGRPSTAPSSRHRAALSAMMGGSCGAREATTVDSGAFRSTSVGSTVDVTPDRLSTQRHGSRFAGECLN
jgi:hypothetical protein